MSYRIFKRSATNWETFARSRKTTVDYVQTEEEARKRCNDFNKNRTPQQVAKGTKYEYTRAE